MKIKRTAALKSDIYSKRESRVIRYTQLTAACLTFLTVCS